MSNIKIVFNINVGYETRSINLKPHDWKNILKGKEFEESVKDSYEGEDYVYTFCFNTIEKGSLSVYYQQVNDEDGSTCGEGYIGEIKDGWITEL